MDRGIEGTAGPLVPPFKAAGIVATPGRVILLLGVVLALILALPGQTVTTTMLEPLFTIFDGIHRVNWGQVPTRDFHTALGPLAFYLPTLGYRISGSFGAAMPQAMALQVLGLAGLCAHIFTSRLHAAISLPFATFLLVILAVPMNLGEGVTNLSFAMFYNRVGWTGLAALLVMYLRPSHEHKNQLAWDTVAATLVALALLYTRATYGLVALGFLLFMLTDRQQRRWAGAALLATSAGVVIVEFFWGSTLLYAADILQVFQVSGLVRGSLTQIFEHFLGNLADYLLLGLLAGLALGRKWSLRDTLFYLFCAAAGFWLINQNDQRWGIIAIHAAAVVASERLLRGMAQDARRIGPVVNPAGVTLYFFALVFPTLVHCSIALGLHFVTALGAGGEPLPLQRMQGVRLADLWTAGEFGGSKWYLGTVADGIAALHTVDAAGHVFVLNGPNPFGVALNLPPPTGDTDELRWGSNVNEAVHLAPPALLGDVRVLLERINSGGSGPLGALYMPYIQDNFELVSSTPNWRLWRRAADKAITPSSAFGQAPG